MRILFTGGGTGGHIYPIIAVKQTLERIQPEADFLYIGPDKFSKRALEKEGIKYKFILSGKLRRYFSLLNFIDLLKIPFGLIQSLWHIFWFMPDVVFSKGGYGSFPATLACWLYRIPIIIHESDSVPGLANKVLSRLAKRIIVSFEETKNRFPVGKTILLGNPIREELLQGSRAEGEKLFELTSDKPVILIMGGSQGARRINELVLNILPRLLEKFEVIHICGKKNFKFLKEQRDKLLRESELAKKRFYHLYQFLEEELKHAYAVADIIVSRAGAGGVFEIAAVGKPSILIPLSNSASDHQTKNAQALAKIGGAVILKEENLTMNLFLDAIFELINNPKKAEEMGRKAKSFYNSSTNQKIAEEILRLCE